MAICERERNQKQNDPDGNEADCNVVTSAPIIGQYKSPLLDLRHHDVFVGWQRFGHVFFDVRRRSRSQDWNVREEVGVQLPNELGVYFGTP